MVAKIKEKRKILVTGSSGMLGTDLCKELSLSYDVVGLDISKANKTLQCDITSKDNVTEVVKKTKPDLIVHVAAWTDVDGCEENPKESEKVNTLGTENVVSSASELNIPVVYMSTDFVFDGEKKTPYKEEDKTSALSAYGKSKLEGEKVVSKLSKYLIVRSGWLYGENGKNFVDTMLDKSKNDKTINVVSDQKGSPTYTKDLAKAIKKLVDINGCESKGIYHISNKGEISWCDYAKEILKLAGVNNLEVVPISGEKYGRSAKRPSYSVLDNSKFEKDTNYKMRSWKEALKEYISGKK